MKAREKSKSSTNHPAKKNTLKSIYNRRFVVRGQKYSVGETAAAYTLLVPSLITIIVLFLLPLIMLIVLSFTDYRLSTGTMQFNGLENYIYLFTSDKFGKAMLNTVVFAVVKLTLDLVLALGIALLLDSNVMFRSALRTIYFSPVVVPVVACSLIWLWFYDPGIGPLNQILGWFGIEPLKWLYSEKTAMLSIILFSVWHGLGYNVVLLLSGLQGISGEYLEAAKLDGATEWDITRTIKIPLLKPIINFVLMMGIINAFKAFSEVNVMTPDGGPGYSTAMAVNYIYEQAFTNGRMGRGAAASIILFAVIFILTMVKTGWAAAKILTHKGRNDVMKSKRPLYKRYNLPGTVLLILGGFIMVFPFVWMVLSAFKTNADVYAYPPKWLPSSWSLDNFQAVFDMIPFWRYYANSLFTSAVATFLQVIISIFAAYALTKLRFPGKSAMYRLIQSSMFVPTVVTIIPLFFIVSQLGLVDTYAGIILPQIMSAFTTILIMSFFVDIPTELLEAARIDGCGYFRACSM